MDLGMGWAFVYTSDWVYEVCDWVYEVCDWVYEVCEWVYANDIVSNRITGSSLVGYVHQVHST